MCKITHKPFRFRFLLLTHFTNKTESFSRKTIIISLFSASQDTPNKPWRNHNPTPCWFQKVVAWRPTFGDKFCRYFRECNAPVWQAMWRYGLVGQVRLWGVGLSGNRLRFVAFSFSWCWAVRGGLSPLPTSHEERRSPFVCLLIMSEGSGKPLQLISTKKFAPKHKLSTTYSRC